MLRSLKLKKNPGGPGPITSYGTTFSIIEQMFKVEYDIEDQLVGQLFITKNFMLNCKPLVLRTSTHQLIRKTDSTIFRGTCWQVILSTESLPEPLRLSRVLLLYCPAASSTTYPSHLGKKVTSTKYPNFVVSTKIIRGRYVKPAMQGRS